MIEGLKKAQCCEHCVHVVRIYPADYEQLIELRCGHAQTKPPEKTAEPERPMFSEYLDEDDPGYAGSEGESCQKAFSEWSEWSERALVSASDICPRFEAKPCP